MNSINKIKSYKKKVGISLNPETSVSKKLLPILNLIDLGFGNECKSRFWWTEIYMPESFR